MTCKICTKHCSRQTSSNLTNTNKFLTGCTNFRISTIEDHGPCAMHRNAIAIETAKSALASASDIRATDAGKALMALKTAEKARLMYLFRNAHAVMTFVKIGVMKLKTGLTYMNIQENKLLHLNCVNFFWSSKVQGTFGMTVILLSTKELGVLMDGQ